MISSSLLKILLRHYTFFGFTISLNKTEVLLQPTPNSTACVHSMSIDGTELKTVENLKYLGSVICNDETLDKEINTRISKVNEALF